MSHVPVRREGRRAAFTLIELLVVVAIISLLISILLPSLSRARSASRVVKCSAILKQMGAAHHMYANETNDWFVPNYLSNGRFWIMNIKYRANLGLQANGTGKGLPDGLLCPDLPDTHKAFQRRTNYGVNNTRHNTAKDRPNNETAAPWHGGDYFPSGANSLKTGQGNGIRIFRGKVRNASGKIQMSDGCDWLVRKAGADFTNPRRWDGLPETNASGNVNEAGGGLWNSVAYRHLEGANLLMFDGHAEYRQKQLVWVLRPNGNVHAGKTNDLWFQYR